MPDLILAALGLTLAAVGIHAVSSELLFHLDSPVWTTMWESGPLQVAMNTFESQKLYTDWTQGPVHLAIYGPLYHWTLGLLAQIAQGDADTLVALARGLSMIALAVAAIGTIIYVRLTGVPMAAALISPVCLLLITRTGLRFLASARPDGLAVMFSILALLAGTGRGPLTAAATILLLTAAWQTKMTSVAALIALALFLVYTRRFRRLIWISAGTIILNSAILAILSAVTQGWALRHLFAPSAAPMKAEYLWLMLTVQPSFELQALVVLPAIALLLCAWPGLPQARDADRAHAATAYLLAAWLVALLTGMHQGSDRNYLIEPALAAGLVLGIFAGRVALAGKADAMRSVWIARTVSLVTLICAAILLLPGRYARSGSDMRELRNLFAPYGSEACDWVRSLPQPMLNLDSWVTFKAGVPNDLNDSIAYVCMLDADTQDVIAERAMAGFYRSIILFGGLHDDGALWGDIPRIWPALREAVAARYTLHEQRDGWSVYVIGTHDDPA